MNKSKIKQTKALYCEKFKKSQKINDTNYVTKPFFTKLMDKIEKSK